MPWYSIHQTRTDGRDELFVNRAVTLWRCSPPAPTSAYVSLTAEMSCIHYANERIMPVPFRSHVSSFLARTVLLFSRFICWLNHMISTQLAWPKNAILICKSVFFFSSSISFSLFCMWAAYQKQLLYRVNISPRVSLLQVDTQIAALKR